VGKREEKEGEKRGIGLPEKHKGIKGKGGGGGIGLKCWWGDLEKKKRLRLCWGNHWGESIVERRHHKYD